MIANYIFDHRFLYQVLATAVTYSTLRIILLYAKRKKRYQLLKHYKIPGPEPTLYEGNLGAYLGRELGAELDLKYKELYGKVYGIFIGDEPSLLITDLDILKKVFLEESQSFTERSSVFLDTQLTKGLLFARYPRWKAMRKILMPAFNRYNVRRTPSMEFVEEGVALMSDYLERKKLESKAAGQDFVIDVHSLMKATALHVISEMAIRLPNVQVKEDEPHVAEFDRFLDTSSQGAVHWAIRFPFIKSFITFIAVHFEIDRTLASVHRSINNIIDQGVRRDYDEDKSSVIDVLVKLYSEGKMSRDEVIGNADTILLAGYDTTSTTLTYVFWVIAKYPEVQHKLRDELMAHGTESKYLEQVIQETMRLYPTVMSFTTRLATKTVFLDQLTIPQGCRVILHNYLMHRDPQIWPDPLKFDPERFKEGLEIHPCAYAPFGLGDRKCIGFKLAMLQIKIIVCKVILNYRLTLIQPSELKIVTHSVVLSKPKEKVLLKLEAT